MYKLGEVVIFSSRWGVQLLQLADLQLSSGVIRPSTQESLVAAALPSHNKHDARQLRQTHRDTWPGNVWRVTLDDIAVSIQSTVNSDYRNYINPTSLTQFCKLAKEMDQNGSKCLGNIVQFAIWGGKLSPPGYILDMLYFVYILYVNKIIFYKLQNIQICNCIDCLMLSKCTWCYKVFTSWITSSYFL